MQIKPYPPTLPALDRMIRREICSPMLTIDSLCYMLGCSRATYYRRIHFAERGCRQPDIRYLIRYCVACGLHGYPARKVFRLAGYDLEALDTYPDYVVARTIIDTMYGAPLESKNAVLRRAGIRPITPLNPLTP